MSKSLYQQAKALRKLLDKSTAWLKGTTAATSSGIQTIPTDPAACMFCLIGGIARVTNPPNALQSVGWDAAAATPLGQLIGKIIDGQRITPQVHPCRPVQPQHIYGFNDATTHDRLLDVLDVAVAFAKGAEKAGVEP